MPDALKPVTLEKALLATRESMRVKRELVHLLTARVTDEKSAITYEADLGTFKLGTEFYFRLENVLGEALLHFENLDVAIRTGDAPAEVRLKIPKSGENAITLITTCDADNQWHAKLSVAAGGVGRVIEHEDGSRDDRQGNKRVFIWRFRAVAQRPMVGWYEPPLLLRTLSEVVVSKLFGGHSDYRLLEALGAESEPVYDYTSHYLQDQDGQYVADEEGRLIRDDTTTPKEEIWIDYVADTGDGWNSTYAIAYHLAQPKLVISDTETIRGEILIFGGDQVYPTATRLQYKQRLVEPYRTALRYSTPPQPDVFAIPGNHDWYDSLVSFTNLFCSRRWFNGWRAPQRRSYFALQLPHRWWLLGIDIQLKSDLDHAQIKYFESIARQIKEGDRVILATAEPHWLRAKVFEKYGPEFNESNLAFLENNVLGKRVTVFLAGDLHYYRRHESTDGTQKIVSGGGGAFLSPTHTEDDNDLRGGFKLKATFPDKATSRRLTWRNLFFLYYNRRFGVLTALLYFLTSWAVMSDIGHFGIRDFDLAFTTTVRMALVQAGAVFWILLMLLGLVAFTNTKSKPYQWIAGLLHGLSHLLAIFFIGWGATYFTVSYLDLAFQSPLQLLISACIIFAGGWVVGSLLVGIFLIISLNVFRCLQVSAFSSLRIEDWKNFLRMKIDSNGDLTIYPIGIRRVPRNWKRRPTAAAGPELVPDDPGATPPELIEPPVIIKNGVPAR